MSKVERLEKYTIRDNFITKKYDETQDNIDISEFFDPDDLFKVGITEEEFIKKYQRYAAIFVFNIEKNETNESYDLSSITEEELADIEKVAKMYFEFVDKNDDGIISEEEIEEIASRDGDSESISDEDLESLTLELFPEETEETEETEIEDLNSIEPSNQVSSAGGSGGGGYSSAAQSTQNTDTKTYTKEELEEQKKQKQTELNTARNDLKKLYEKGNQEVDDAEQEYNDAVQNDENITDELKAEQKENSEAIGVKEQEINSLKSELVDVNANIANYNSIITSKNSEISALKTALSTLESNKSEDSNVKSQIEAKKAEINKNIPQLDSEIKAAEEELKNANTRKSEIEKEMSVKEKELDALNNKKTEIDSKISSIDSEKTKEAFSKYQNAKTQFDETIKKAEENIVTLQKEIDELDKQINEKQANEIQNDYSVTKLTKTYTLNGQEYLCLLSQKELESFLQNEWARGNYNHDGNCDSMSNQYCKDIMRMLGKSANYIDYTNDSEEAVIQKARESLDNGYPVTLHVIGVKSKGTRHFATAVGYRVKDDGSIVFLLADNVRGVGITACGEGEYRHLISGYSTPYSSQNYGYRCMYYA